MRCTEHELERRIRARDCIDWQKQEELNGTLEAQITFDNQFPIDEIFKMINTAELSEREMVQKILLAIAESKG